MKKLVITIDRKSFEIELSNKEHVLLKIENIEGNVFLSRVEEKIELTAAQRLEIRLRGNK